MFKLGQYDLGEGAQFVAFGSRLRINPLPEKSAIPVFLGDWSLLIEETKTGVYIAAGVQT
jgi:hypothetical protein